MKRGWSLTLLLVLLAAACGGEPEQSAVTSPPTTAPVGSPTAKPSALPADDADIAVTSPENGSTVRGPTVTISTEVSGFKLVDNIGKKAVQGEGHIIFYMGSGYTVPTALAKPATAGGTGSFISTSSAKPEYTWENVMPGTVTFRVQLVNNDKTPLDPPQVEETTVTIQG